MTRGFELSARSGRRHRGVRGASAARRLLVVAMLLASLVALSIAPAAAATLTFVTPGALNDWDTLSDSTAATAFENGPGSPPLGSGSVQLTVGSDGNSSAQVRYLNASGTRLDEITTLTYSTYVDDDATGGPIPDQAPYLILNIDYTGDNTADDRLFFEPEYQRGLYVFVPGDGPITPQGPIAEDVWQTWDALAGGWWSLNDATFGPPLRTIDGYLALHPNARLINEVSGRPGLRIVAGGGAGSWDNFVGNADNLTLVADTIDRTFDFELGTNLAIGKSASAGEVDAGGELTYTLSVVNAGPGNAPNVVVSDILPAGTTFVSCTSSHSGVCGGTGNSRQVTFATLPAGVTATILITVAVDEDLADGAALANTATVTSYEPDTNATDDSSTVTVTVSNPCVSPFVDVPNDSEACAAIVALTGAGVIQGYDTNPPTFGPADPVQRAQMAAFLVRALDWGDRPTGPRDFTDLDELLGDLPTASRILANACDESQPGDTGCVAQGYAAADCIAMGKVAPCFGPTDQVSYAQVISFLARAFQLDENYAWESQPGGAQPYGDVPAVHDVDIRTYHHYAGTIPDAPFTGSGWNAPAPREWVARVIYQALQSAPPAP